MLGSSFAGDALARQELAFANQEDAIRADAFLQELTLSNNLINSEFGLRRGEFETLLNEQNFRGKVAGDLASASVSAQAANQRAQARAASQPTPVGSFLSSFGSSAGKAAGEGFGTIFNGD